MNSSYRPRVKPKPSPIVAIVTLILGLIVFALLAYAIVQMGAESPKIQRSLGANDIFRAGNAESLADEIASNGPILYPDLLKRQAGTIVFVQHLGSNPKEGWFAFSARADGATTNCQVAWQAAKRTFLDKCSGAGFPEDGKGLTQYKVNVINGAVQIDLKASP